MATMTTLAPGGTANPPASSRRTLLMVLCAVAIVAVSVDSGVEALGGNKLLRIIPLGGFAGIGLAALGLVNFENSSSSPSPCAPASTSPSRRAVTPERRGSRRPPPQRWIRPARWPSSSS